MKTETPKTLHTKFGKAVTNNHGYYQITTGINAGKYLHRLIFENFYNMQIPKHYLIHHKNGNKKDNCILNLQLMRKSEHSIHHNLGSKASEKTKQLMRKTRQGKNNSFYGKKHSKKSKIKMSKSNNTSGYYRVYKSKEKNIKQGYRWVYRYQKNGKTYAIKDVNIKRLEDKVKARGLDWIKYDD